MGGVRQWVTGGTLYPIKGFYAGCLVQTKRLFWSVIYRRLLLLTSSLRPRLRLVEKTQAEERERASTRYPPWLTVE